MKRKPGLEKLLGRLGDTTAMIPVCRSLMEKPTSAMTAAHKEIVRFKTILAEGGGRCRGGDGC